MNFNADGNMLRKLYCWWAEQNGTVNSSDSKCVQGRNQSNTMMFQSHMQLRKLQNKILILKAGLSLLPRKAVQQIASGNAIAKSMQQVKDTDWETVIKLHDIAYYIAQHGLPFTQFEIIHIWKKYVFYTGGYENLTVCKNFILNISDYFFQEHIKKKMELINFIAVLCS